MRSKAGALFAASVAGACLVACGTADGAAPGGARVPGWRVVARVVVPGRQAVLVSADAPRAGNAWVAGFDLPDGSQDLTRAVPVLEHWAGRSWRRENLPSRARHAFGLFDPFTLTVRVSPRLGVWLFGTRWLRLTGRTWNAGSLPAAGPGWTVNADSAVVSADDVWVFGIAYGRFTKSAYAARYSGARWRLTAVPGTRLVAAASAVSSRDIWAVLGRPAVDLDPVPGPGAAVVRWDGTRWARVPIPARLSAHGYLTSVLARTDRDVWVAGGLRRDAGGLAPAVAHWNGHRWNVERLPAPGPVRNYVVSSIVADGHGGAWAAGLCSTCNRPVPGLMWHLHDGRWSPPVPDYAGSDATALTLAQVGRTSSVWGVGEVPDRSSVHGMIALFGRSPR